MVDRSNPNCNDCGQWYMKDIEHDCNPNAPITVSAPLGKYGTSLDKIVFAIVDCDSGAGFGYRDYQMEMFNAEERLKVVEALKEYKDLRWGYYHEKR